MFGDDQMDLLPPPAKPMWQRIGVPAVSIVVVAAGAYEIYRMVAHSGPAMRPHKESHIMQVKLPPPPPPPPPPKIPPPPQKPQEQKKIEQPKLVQAKPPPKAPSPPAGLQTSIKGAGTSDLGVGNNGGGDCLSDCGSGGDAGQSDAYYASLVKSQIKRAVERDDRLRLGSYNATVEFWVDASGQVTRVSVQSYSGEPDLQEVIRNVVMAFSMHEAVPGTISSRPIRISLSAIRHRS